MTNTISFGITSAFEGAASGFSISAKVPPGPPLASTAARFSAPDTFQRRMKSRFGTRSATSSEITAWLAEIRSAERRCDTDQRSSIGVPASSRKRTAMSRPVRSAGGVIREASMTRVVSGEVPVPCDSPASAAPGTYRGPTTIGKLKV